jgi:hypothetical protein
VTETWKPVPGFEDYEVSDLGNVRTLKRRGGYGKRKLADHPRLLSQSLDDHGRPRVNFRVNGKAYCRNVCVLVLQAFAGPRPGRLTASHLDGNAANNRADNLIWESMADNLARKYAHGTLNAGRRHYNYKDGRHSKYPNYGESHAVI